MQDMPLTCRQGMFQVKTDRFKQACLPYPQKIISIVNEHLPAIAVKKNGHLLTIIKVRLKYRE